MVSINNDMINYIDQLLGVVEAKDWTTFEAIALGNPRVFQLVSNQISSFPEFNSMTLLHACVRYNPPVHMIAQMIDLCPHLTGARDCLDRTPLHVAAGTGASASLIMLLARACPSACTVLDEDGRTPLHLACDISCELFEDEDNIEPRRSPCHATIRELLSHSLHAASLEDDEGTSPLEYAIISDASIEVVCLLQKATQTQIMKKSSLRTLSPDDLSVQQRHLVGPVHS